jgi:epsilon-lactone hydrolase
MPSVNHCAKEENPMASPQFAALLQRQFENPPWERTTQELRDNWENTAGMLPVPGDTRIDAVDAGGVHAEWISAEGSEAQRVIMHLHGGGYVIGSLNTHRWFVQALCKASGARALNVGYRLAPENPFPAAVEDSTRAYRWLLGQGIEPSRVIIAGDSAGGGLAVATALAARDAGEPLPAALVCVSPWVDMEASGESMVTRAAADPLIQKEWLLKCAADYLGDGDRRSPLASPLFADLQGFPPMLVQVGDSETLLDDSRRLAELGRRAGIDVTLDIWKEMTHLWQLTALLVPEGQQAIDRIGEWVRRKVPVPAAAS